MGTKRTQEENEKSKQSAIQILKDNIRPGQTIYCDYVRHITARDGDVTRIYKILTIHNDGKLWNISAYVARALNFKYYESKASGSGVGADDGFSVVYGLSVLLFCPDAYDHDKAYSLKEYTIS